MTSKSSAALRAFGAYAGGASGSMQAKGAWEVSGPSGTENPVACSAACTAAASWFDQAAEMARAAAAEFLAMADKE